MTLTTQECAVVVGAKNNFLFTPICNGEKQNKTNEVEANGTKKVKDFKHKGRRCVVIEIDRGGNANLAREFLEGPGSSAFKPYCNGYVQLKEDEFKDHYNDYDISSEELTYQGDLKFKGLDASDGEIYVGFDTAHAWNEQQPESKTAEAVAEVCKKIVNEFEKAKTKRGGSNASNKKDK